MLMLAKTTKEVEYKEVVVGLSVALVLFLLILAVLLWWLRKRWVGRPIVDSGPCE